MCVSICCLLDSIMNLLPGGLKIFMSQFGIIFCDRQLTWQTLIAARFKLSVFDSLGKIKVEYFGSLV